MTLLTIYIIGYVLTMVLIFIDNKHTREKTDIADALVTSLFSWFTVIIFLASVIDGRYDINRINKWFMRE